MLLGFLLPGGAPVKFEDAPRKLLGLMPEALIYSLLENIQSPRPKGISVTMLTTPCLRKSYYQVTKDYYAPLEDTYWSSYRGSMIHNALAKLKEYKPEYIVERRFEKQLAEGLSVSGQIDLYKPNSKTLVDYKTCALIRHRYLPYGEHLRQCEFYKILLEPEYPVEKIQIVYLDGMGFATVKFGKRNVIQFIRDGKVKFIGTKDKPRDKDEILADFLDRVKKLQFALLAKKVPPAIPNYLCSGANKRHKIYCPFKNICENEER